MVWSRLNGGMRHSMAWRITYSPQYGVACAHGLELLSALSRRLKLQQPWEVSGSIHLALELELLMVPLRLGALGRHPPGRQNNSPYTWQAKQ